jgi:hypothetical protein
LFTPVGKAGLLSAGDPGASSQWFYRCIERFYRCIERFYRCIERFYRCIERFYQCIDDRAGLPCAPACGLRDFREYLWLTKIEEMPLRAIEETRARATGRNDPIGPTEAPEGGEGEEEDARAAGASSGARRWTSLA